MATLVRNSLTALSLLMIMAAGPPLAQTQNVVTEKIIYNFAAGADGQQPEAALIRDTKGNLYGTTVLGGSKDDGTIFGLNPRGIEKVLYSFSGFSDGAVPSGPLVLDSQGNLYGTAAYGGVNNNGTVFELTRTGTLKVLYSFTGGSDGTSPSGGLIRDALGNLYGVTRLGGNHSEGTIFKVAPDGNESVLYTFTGASDGGEPRAGLIMDAQGSLYGTAANGGPNLAGTVFKLTSSGAFSVLHAFGSPNGDGGSPQAPLILDANGNLYGTTEFGGAQFSGTVFKVTAAGLESVIYSFTGGTDGARPIAGLIRDPKGNLYGTTTIGGNTSCHCGVVFKLTLGGTESVVYTFGPGPDGSTPFASLLSNGKGGAYSTTSAGGANAQGTVFELVP